MEAIEERIASGTMRPIADAAFLHRFTVRESAIFISIMPGQYTAIVRGVSETTGIGLVEVYNLQ